MNDKLAVTLRYMGDLTVPAAFDEDAADDRIEIRLHRIYDLNRGSAPTTAASGSDRIIDPRRRVYRALACALVMASVLGVVIAQRDTPQNPRRHLILVAARETEIRDADGKPVATRLGSELREGAVIRVGLHGSAVVGSLTLIAGTVAHVQDGKIIIDTPGVTTTTGRTTPTTIGAAPHRATTSSLPNSGQSTPASPTTAADQTPSTTTSERPTFSSAAPPTTSGGSATTAGADGHRPIAARLRVAQATLTAEWRWPANEKVVGIIIIAHGPGTDPKYPVISGSGTAQIFATRQRATGSAAIRWVSGARILVVAVDRNQRVVAQSTVLITPAR